MNQDSKWMFQYQAIQDYFSLHQSFNVPKDTIFNGKNLFNWVTNQQQLYRKGMLSDERIELLQKISFPLGNKKPVQPVQKRPLVKKGSKWDERFQLLKKYLDEDPTRKPAVTIVYQGVNLGKWIDNQRHLFKHGKLHNERIDKLTSIGFEFTPNTDQWEKGFRLLLDYKKMFGDTAVPKDLVIDGFSLGSWANYQRSYSGDFKKGTLTHERNKRLKEIGFVFNIHEYNWQYHFSLLRNFYQDHGHVNVHYLYEVNGVKLGSWVRTQINQRHHLSTEQRDSLSSLGVTFDVKDIYSWEESFEALQQFYQKHSHSNVPPDYECNGIKLGSWVNNQRHLYRHKLLDRMKIQLLDSVQFVSDVYEYRWQVFYEHFLSYIREHGHLIPPTSYEKDGVKLGRWVERQRRDYREGRLNPSKIQLLEEAGFVFVSMNR